MTRNSLSKRPNLICELWTEGLKIRKYNPERVYSRLYYYGISIEKPINAESKEVKKNKKTRKIMPT